MIDSEWFKRNSLPFESGGETHMHPWDSGTGWTVTTRLPGGYTDHIHIRDNGRIFTTPENLSGFRNLFDPNKPWDP
jgi:hypothetical protein